MQAQVKIFIVVKGYGSNIQATIAYLNTRQGTICNLLQNFAEKAKPACAIIATKIKQQIVVGADEIQSIREYQYLNK